MDIVLANPGEGIEGGTVTGVMVKVGDAVKAGQVVAEVSTDKASMEVAAEADGTVSAVHVKPGDKVSVGGKLITLSGGAKLAAPPAQPKHEQPKPEPAKAASAERPKGASASADVVLANPGEGIEGGTVTAVMVKAGDAVKVGQGLVEVSTDKASMEVTAEVGGTVEAVHVKPGDKVAVGAKLVTISTSSQVESAPPKSAPPAQPARGADAPRVPQPHATHAAASSNGTATKTLIPAGPATRKLARELVVALAEVCGTARGGRVTLDDLK
ncbi:MAG: biotin/lipoyl-containing protein, partial [Gemmata sp.]